LCGILFTTVNTTEFARFYFKHAQSTNDLRWYLVDISNIAREIEASSIHVHFTNQFLYYTIGFK
jgi:hypothetical protein